MTIVAGNSTVVGTGTQFTTQLNVGDAIDYLATNDTYYRVVVKTIANNTHITVSPTPNTDTVAISTNIFVFELPKYVPVSEATETISSPYITKLTSAEAEGDFFREKGIKTPGWNRVITYTDAHGATRVKSEPLVVFKSTES